MARGPLPNPEKVRRNAPTIPTTNLPAGGRTDPAPECPVALGAAGRAWWEWAWHTPQAAAWSAGDLYTVARRAQIEDDLHVLDEFDDGSDLIDLIGTGEEYDETVKQVAWVMGKLRGLAGNRVTVSKAATDLDDRLGLTPKGMAALRWKIVEPEKPAAARPGSRRRALSAVPQVG